MKRAKKYNPLKQLELLGRASLKNSAIGFVTGGVGCQIIDLRNNKISSASQTTVHLIATLRHRWSVLVAVLGVDDNGKHYMKSKEITVTRPVLQAELIEVLNEEHAALGKNFNQKHLLSYGWIATPFVKEWDEEAAFNLLTSLGAFEFERTENNEVIALEQNSHTKEVGGL